MPFVPSSPRRPFFSKPFFAQTDSVVVLIILILIFLTRVPWPSCLVSASVKSSPPSAAFRRIFLISPSPTLPPFDSLLALVPHPRGRSLPRRWFAICPLIILCSSRSEACTTLDVTRSRSPLFPFMLVLSKVKCCCCCCCCCVLTTATTTSMLCFLTHAFIDSECESSPALGGVCVFAFPME